MEKSPSDFVCFRADDDDLAGQGNAKGMVSASPTGYIGGVSTTPSLVVSGQDKGRAMGSASLSPLPPQRETEPSAKKNGVESEEQTGMGIVVEMPPARSGLTPEQKRFIVEGHACFLGISAISDGFLREFGIKLDDRTICGYDPLRPHAKLGRRLRALYDAARAAYVKETAKIAIAHQAHRLRLIADVVEKATISKDYTAALKGIELAAKEANGALEGKTVVEHRGAIAHVHGSVEEARAEVAMRLAALVEGGQLLPALTAPPAVDVEDAEFSAVSAAPSDPTPMAPPAAP